MASVEDRGESGFRVVWREYGQKQYERFATAAEAEQFRQLVEVSGNRWPRGWVRGQGMAQQSSDCMTFRAWAERAIAARAKANRRTRADYKRDLTNHVYPTFGDTPLDLIEGETVGAWLVALQDGPMSDKTMKNVHALASSIYQDAIQAGRAPGPNPFRGKMRALPTVRTEEMVFLTPQEVDLIATVIGHYRALVLFLAHTGLRWSEATALKVADVELFGKRKTVTVTKAWKRDDDGTFYVGEPKSRRARRTVVLDAVTVDALIPLVASRKSSDWLFTSPTGRIVQHSTFRKDHWVPALTKAEGLEKQPRIHDLRHSQASWLIAAGLPLTAVQRRLGHESIQTTSDRYGHLDADMDDRVVAALDNIGTPADLAASLSGFYAPRL